MSECGGQPHKPQVPITVSVRFKGSNPTIEAVFEEAELTTFAAKLGRWHVDAEMRELRETDEGRVQACT